MERLGNEKRRRIIKEEQHGGQVEQGGESSISNKEADQEYHNEADDKEEVDENEKEEENMFSNISTRRATALPTKEELEATCAKWCRMLNNGSCQWDRTKINCFLSEDELNDPLLVRNIIHGTILSSQVHPLIFETGMDDDDEIRLRSLPYLNQLLADGEKGISTYQSLSSDQKLIVAVGVRDLYLGAWHGVLSNQEKCILDGLVQMLDETVGCVQAMGMNVSFHPSTNFKVVKLIEALDDAVGADWAPLFAQIGPELPKLFMVFVNPVELSFHNFENIIPLDFWIERKLENEGLGGLSLSMSNVHRLQKKREVFTCRLEGPACDLMKELSSLDLYVEPLNKAARGGERFIFHSALLCKALSRAVAGSNLLNKLARGRIGQNFEFVNYVFRMNRFKSDDAIFAPHRDTPYYDSARSHISKYTLLIYLTRGRNEPALRIDDVELNEIEEMTCVIFDQSYEHEGSPFINGNKRFIRSELVFTDKDLSHNSQIASLFSEACYMTGQSVLDEDLTSYAHDCFERANSLHWAIEKEASQPPVYLQKQFHEISFMTNGYNYWFEKDCGVDVTDCAMVVVLDYFNCKIGGQPFRSLCSTTTIRKRFDKPEEIWTNLQDGGKKKAEPFKRVNLSDLGSLMDKARRKPFLIRSDHWEDNGGIEPHLGTCLRHREPLFDAWKCPAILKLYTVYRKYTQTRLFRAPLLMFDQELVINESNIKVAGDKIFFLKMSDDKLLPRINFASCWDCPDSTREFIGLDQEISIQQFLVPPITFRELDQGYHLVLDFFRNDWMIRVEDESTIPIPSVLENSTPGEAPFSKKISSKYDYNTLIGEEDPDSSLGPYCNNRFRIFKDDENFRNTLVNRNFLNNYPVDKEESEDEKDSEDEEVDSKNKESSEDEEDSDSLRNDWDRLFYQDGLFD